MKYDYDPLIKMAVSHYQFKAMHPFRDENGRTGRILRILFLIQKQLLDVPILYLSAYTITSKDDYYALLNKVTIAKKWEDWILYMLEAIEETAIYTQDKVNEIDLLSKRTQELINEKLPHIRKEIIEKVFEQPYTSPKSLVNQLFGIKSINTAKKYLRQMEKLGIMIPEQIGKEIVYINIDLLNLLSET